LFGKDHANYTVTTTRAPEKSEAGRGSNPNRDQSSIAARGQAEVIRDEDDQEILLTRLGPGEWVCEMAFLSLRTRNATVPCLEALEVLIVHKCEFSLLAPNLSLP
jgi:hypothetical protein